MLIRVRYASGPEAPQIEHELEVDAPRRLESPAEAAARIISAFISQCTPHAPPTTEDHRCLEQTVLTWILESPDPDLRRGVRRPISYRCQRDPATVSSTGGFQLTPEALASLGLNPAQPSSTTTPAPPPPPPPIQWDIG